MSLCVEEKIEYEMKIFPPETRENKIDGKNGVFEINEKMKSNASKSFRLFGNDSRKGG